jgi:hypothetical protein
LINTTRDWGISKQNQLIDASVAKSLIGILDGIQQWRNNCYHSLVNRLQSAPKTGGTRTYYSAPQEYQLEHFTLIRLIHDLNLTDLAGLLARLMGYKKNSYGGLLSSPLFTLLDNVLLNILKKFDNTMYRPTDNRVDPVLPTAFHRRVKNLDATALDPYYRHQKPQYQSFIRTVETLQRRYGELPDQLSANGKSIRQEFLLLMMANAADFSIIHFGWFLDLLEELVPWASAVLVDGTHKKDFENYVKYLVEQRDYLSREIKKRNFQLIAPNDWVFKNMVALLNQNSLATTLDLQARIDESPMSKSLEKALELWEHWRKRQGIDVPTHHKWQYIWPWQSINYGLHRKECSLLKDLIPHWPTDWYKPAQHYRLDSDYNRVTAKISPDQPEQETELTLVPDDVIAGSIAYLAIQSHSISRHQLHYGPNIYGNLLQSCLNVTSRMKLKE